MRVLFRLQIEHPPRPALQVEGHSQRTLSRAQSLRSAPLRPQALDRYCVLAAV